uniref:Uncharacterized protein n=1 Tax=Zea mays TaxID=4577 RepID=B8A3L3_MAIZE|nr:unknown [Zea mays]|eukprot:XP_023157023.1 uncharacterized protein LOC111590442 [Zea mays]
MFMSCDNLRQVPQSTAAASHTTPRTASSLLIWFLLPGIQRQVLLPHQVTPAPSAPPIHGSYCASMASTYLCLRPLLHQPLVSNLHPPINAVRLSPTVLLISPDLPGPNVGGTVSPERLQRSP